MSGIPTRKGQPPPTAAEQSRVLDAVARIGLKDAARECGYNPQSISHWRKTVPGFAERMDAAKLARRAAIDADKAIIRGAVLDRLREGWTFDAAASSVGVTAGGIHGWRRADPAYARAVEAARSGLAGDGERKAALLDILASGVRLKAASARLAVSCRTVMAWRRTDPTFGAEYARVVGPTGHPVSGAKLRRVIDRVYAGETVWMAAASEHVSNNAIHRAWDRYPATWSQIVAAYEATGRRPPRRRVQRGEGERCAA